MNGKRSRDRASGKAADLERDFSNESVAKRKAAPFNSPVSIRIVSHRSRLVDPDNISGKAAVDGLVHCGLLRDDSPKEVASYRADEQIKVKGFDEQYTIITITEVDP